MSRKAKVDLTGDKDEKPTLLPFEKETIISFNQGEKEAQIYTYEKSWQKHLEQKLGLKPTTEDGWGGKTYILDKHRIKPPRASSSKKKD